MTASRKTPSLCSSARPATAQVRALGCQAATTAAAAAAERQEVSCSSTCRPAPPADEFYRMRASITQMLIEERGFSAGG